MDDWCYCYCYTTFLSCFLRDVLLEFFSQQMLCFFHAGCMCACRYDGQTGKSLTRLCTTCIMHNVQIHNIIVVFGWDEITGWGEDSLSLECSFGTWIWCRVSPCRAEHRILYIRSALIYRLVPHGSGIGYQGIFVRVSIRCWWVWDGGIWVAVFYTFSVYMQIQDVHFLKTRSMGQRTMLMSGSDEHCDTAPTPDGVPC